MKTPYTTPKGVRIGSMYTPPARGLEFSADELRIQRALLGERTPTDWDGVAIVIIMAAAAAVFTFWRYA